MSKLSKKELSIIKKIALDRIFYLYDKAIEVVDEDINLARRYIFLLWKIKQKAALKLPKNLRRKFCKRCFTPWIPGKTLRIRVRNNRLIYTCLGCYLVKRIPFNKNKKIRPQ